MFCGSDYASARLLSIEYRRNHKHIFVVSKYAIGIVGVNMPFEFSRFEVIPN